MDTREPVTLNIETLEEANQQAFMSSVREVAQIVNSVSGTRIAQWYVEYQGVDAGALPSLESAIDRRVAGYFPQDEIEPAALLGSWKDKHDTYTFADDANGTWTDRQGRAVSFRFDIQDSAIKLKYPTGETTLYLQQNGRALYVITAHNPRRNGQRFNYPKQTAP